ncbi:hypothetical protein OEZ86_010100 [Tetradesmus obliquus]|uniref:Ribophorin II C-terminal domain-containing protein n=1 Tax=Tetradesmus obliquus TaxID=3088 RepID=A0ABY8UNS3_TETOB|nr:hypothetical protein OEZ85_001534 [Tetradesmus obliquus]WIA43662.1 hypothetical protein OEZ86_010100 [Tetradesmus obliquus]
MRKISCLICLGLLLCIAQAQDAAEPEVQASSEPAADSPPKKASVLGVDSISVTVYAADGKKESTKKGKLDEALLKATALRSGQYVEVSFTPLLDGAPAKPQQAMLAAASKAYPGLTAYAVAKAQKGGSHVASLGTAAIEKQLGSLGGELALSLLLGDPAAPLGVSGSIGSLLLPEAATGSAAPKPKLLTAGHQPVNNFKPNIAHIFRTPDKRAPAVVSLAFTGLALAPLALLVLYLGALGVNFAGFPSGTAGLWALLFHGGIAALLGLYALFWLRLDLASTLPAALGLGAFTALTGYKALSALSAQRAAEAKVAAVAVKKAN